MTLITRFGSLSISRSISNPIKSLNPLLSLQSLHSTILLDRFYLLSTEFSIRYKVFLMCCYPVSPKNCSVVIDLLIVKAFFYSRLATDLTISFFACPRSIPKVWARLQHVSFVSIYSIIVVSRFLRAVCTTSGSGGPRVEDHE